MTKKDEKEQHKWRDGFHFTPHQKWYPVATVHYVQGPGEKARLEDGIIDDDTWSLGWILEKLLLLFLWIVVEFFYYFFKAQLSQRLLVVLHDAVFPGGGGHWPRNGVWGCAALKTPFSRLSCRSQGSHFKQKSQFTRPPFEKIGNFSLYSLNFHPNFSSQAPKFENFPLTSPQIWKFSAHKPPNLEIFRSQAPLFRGKCQFASPTLRKSGPHTPTWKKLSAPPPGVLPVDLDAGGRHSDQSYDIVWSMDQGTKMAGLGRNCRNDKS